MSSSHCPKTHPLIYGNALPKQTPPTSVSLHTVSSWIGTGEHVGSPVFHVSGPQRTSDLEWFGRADENTFPASSVPDVPQTGALRVQSRQGP
ncbi:hypothetical protein DPEC_G00276000 [Dallia pectoralis]|uniref:Uncharacterized protein n=1 Tax=Dallia pectoralis TaxID=75939 RepID=A0ACC2FLD0_DALPE|nr:hypothetical protein DPEC_G00276000 [Dallia pectoralis]